MKITIFEHSDNESFPIGKLFSLDENGNLQKSVNGALKCCIAKQLEVATLAQLKVRILNTNARHFLTSGISSVKHCMVLPVARVTDYAAHDIFSSAEGLPLVGKTKVDFPFTRNTGLLCIDVDGHEKQPYSDLFCAVPELEQYASLLSTSSSSNLYHAETGAEIQGTKGFHLFYHCADASDIPRALEALHKRLYLAGKGHHIISKSGALLERTAVDLAMRTSSQPIFLHSTCEPPLTQKKELTLGDGIEILDTKKVIADLTPSEAQAYAELVAKEKSELAGEVETARNKYVCERVDSLVDAGADRGHAEASIIASLKNAVLDATFQVRTVKGWVSVREILANPSVWNNVPCADPLEPDYNGSLTVAKIFSAQERPVIHSFAHAPRSYFLQGDHSKIGSTLKGELKEIAQAEIEQSQAELTKTHQRALIAAKILQPTDKFADSTAGEHAIELFEKIVSDKPPMICGKEFTLDEMLVCGLIDVHDGELHRLLCAEEQIKKSLAKLKEQDISLFDEYWAEIVAVMIGDNSKQQTKINRLHQGLKPVTNLPIADQREAVNFALMKFNRARLLLQKEDSALANIDSPEDEQRRRTINETQLIKQCGTVIRDPFGEFERALQALGVVGERENAQLTFLCALSSHFNKPAHLAIKGQSSSGKSWTSGQVMRLFPDEVVYWITSASSKALIYEARDFQHTCIYLAEAEALVRNGDEKNDLAELMRVLISENRLVHKVVEKSESGEFVTRTVEKEGPICLITTTTRAALDKELETRMLSTYADESVEQTQSIAKSIVSDWQIEPEHKPMLAEWHAYVEYIRQGPRTVAIPFASHVFDYEALKNTRARRDINTCGSVIKAVALANRRKRKVNSRGAIVAELEDYRIFHDLLATRINQTATDTPPQQQIDLVLWIDRLLRKDEQLYRGANKIELNLLLEQSTTHPHYKFSLCCSERQLAKAYNDASRSTIRRALKGAVGRDLLIKTRNGDRFEYQPIPNIHEHLSQSPILRSPEQVEELFQADTESKLVQISDEKADA